MDPIQELLDWATTHSVKLNGIKPSHIPGRGIGVLATRDIKVSHPPTHSLPPSPQPSSPLVRKKTEKEDEIVLEVPTTVLRTLSTVPKPRLRKLTEANVSVHGILAAELAHDKSDKYAPWSAICPTPQDLTTMPLVWPCELQALLPLRARELLDKQIAKSARDWELVASSYPDKCGREAYTHAWLLVNSRTFYYLDAVLKKRRGLSRDDCLALLPVADLFNHGDAEGCHVAFGGDGFAFRATGPCRRGEEVRICYGRHGGDFLLVEYGFVMGGNRWDEALLDEVLLERLDEGMRERLDAAGFLGGYVLDSETVCYRTQVALRLICCSVGEWMRFVDGSDGGERSQDVVDALLLELLREYRGRVTSTIEKARGLQVGEQAQRDILVARWEQILWLIDTRISSLMNGQSS